MAKEKRFILSDESLNTYGFRVLTDGIDLTDFERNPLMFFDHNTYGLPIGKWADIEKKDGQLTATAVFDEKDEMGKKVADKVAQGFLNAVSIGFDIAETSTESTFVLQGQTRPTITKAKLNEVSIVNFPANRNAYRLSSGTKTIVLSASQEELSGLLPLMRQSNSNNLATIEELVIELGKTKGVVTPANEAHYRTLAKADANALIQLFKQQAAPTVSIIDALKARNPNAPNGSNKNDWTFADWSKKDPDGLLQIKKTDPNRYAELAKNYSH